MRRVSTEISSEEEALLTDLEDEWEMHREEVLRQLIRQGLSDWQKKQALTKLEAGSITIRQAAILADVNYVEMISLASEAGIELGPTVDELEHELEDFQ